MTKDQPCYDRHPGRISFLLCREENGRKDGDIKLINKTVQEHYDPEARFDAVRGFLLTWDSVSVFSVKEQQHFITYTKGNVDELFAIDPNYKGGLDVSDEPKPEKPATLVRPKREKPVRPVAPPVERVVQPKPAPKVRPVRSVPAEGEAKPRAVRGGKAHVIVAGKLPDPPLKGNLAVLYSAYMKAGENGASLAQLIESIGPTLAAGGVQNPSNFISAMTSRLKAAGLVEVKA